MITSGRFDGTITGIGTTSGVRFVLGAWLDTPFGPITDVMIEAPDGHRTLVAPSAEAGRFIAETYGFDEVRVEAVSLRRGASVWTLTAETVQLRILLGRRTLLGRLLRLVPRRLARARWWSRAIDPIASRVRPGVHVIGTAASGREEQYTALDERSVLAVEAGFGGTDCGPLADIDPPVRFGFGSTPRRPSQVRVTTYVRPG